MKEPIQQNTSVFDSNSSHKSLIALRISTKNERDSWEHIHLGYLIAYILTIDIGALQMGFS